MEYISYNVENTLPSDECRKEKGKLKRYFKRMTSIRKWLPKRKTSIDYADSTSDEISLVVPCEVPAIEQPSVEQLLRVEVEELKHIRDNLLSANQDLQQKLEDATFKNTVSDEQKVKADNHLKQIQKQHEGVSNGLNKQLVELKKQLVEKNKHSSNLEKIIANLRTSHKQALLEKDKQIQQLKTPKDTLEKQLASEKRSFAQQIEDMKNMYAMEVKKFETQVAVLTPGASPKAKNIKNALNEQLRVIRRRNSALNQINEIAYTLMQHPTIPNPVKQSLNDITNISYYRKPRP